MGSSGLFQVMLKRDQLEVMVHTLTGYTEQPTAQNTAAAAGYVGYQGSVVPAAAYASAPTQLLIGQTVYAQPAPTQLPTRYELYDHSGNYGSAPATYTLSTM